MEAPFLRWLVQNTVKMGPPCPVPFWWKNHGTMASASGGFPPLTAFHRSWATCPSCGRLTTSGISGMRPAVVLAWRGSSKSVLFHGENSDLHHQCHTSRIEEISLFTTDTNFCSENVPAVRRSHLHHLQSPQPTTSFMLQPSSARLCLHHVLAAISIKGVVQGVGRRAGEGLGRAHGRTERPWNSWQILTDAEFSDKHQINSRDSWFSSLIAWS